MTIYTIIQAFLLKNDIVYKMKNNYLFSKNFRLKKRLKNIRNESFQKKPKITKRRAKQNWIYIKLYNYS